MQLFQIIIVLAVKQQLLGYKNSNLSLSENKLGDSIPIISKVAYNSFISNEMPSTQYQYELTYKNSLSDFPSIISGITSNTYTWNTTDSIINGDTTTIITTKNHYDYSSYLANNRIYI